MIELYVLFLKQEKDETFDFRLFLRFWFVTVSTFSPPRRYHAAQLASSRTNTELEQYFLHLSENNLFAFYCTLLFTPNTQVCLSAYHEAR